ncbi:hypothetical protein KJ656_17535 [bacterium]|nr:hypothetical protein [bacterium]
MNWQEIQEIILKELTPEQLWWVKKNVVLESDDMRKMSTEEIREQFPGGSTPGISTINDSEFIKTFIWQSFLMIKSKELKPIKGNLRSFWYRELRPFYKNHDLLETDEGPPVTLSLREMEMLLDLSLLDPGRGTGRESYLIDKMGRGFTDFVLKGIFRFKGEFDFKDSMDSFRIIGTKRPRLIFYTEKEGLFWFCQEIASKYGISALASRGEPGYLSMEYFADALKIHGVANVEIIALTDYDPWGYNIAEEIGNKMQEPVFGFKVKTTHLTSLDLFTPEVIEYAKRYLGNVSPPKLKQVAKWMKETGGINGEPYGMHIDHAEMDRVRKAVDKWYKKIVRK